MKTRLVFPFLALTVVAVMGVILLRERATARELQARSAALARQESQLSHLRAERERLDRELLLATASQPVAEPVAPVVHAAEVPAPRSAWKTGEWTPAKSWRNEGRATPQATMATLLWAATGGDLAALRDMLHFDDATRAKVRAWFDSVPPAGRWSYATPEDLFAGATLYHVAPTRAQLSWLHRSDNDHAIVGMLLAEPESATPPPGPTIEPAAGNLPPALRATAPYKVVVLNLRRTADGWRVNVPADAIDSLAKRLRTAATN